MNDMMAKLWENYGGQIVHWGTKLFFAIVIIIAANLLAKYLRRVIDHANDRFERFDTTLVPLLKKLASYSIYAIGLVFILDIFGANTASIFALLGAAGIAVGLALKDTLGNIAAGIVLLILRPFKLGEFVEVSGISGTVKEIGLFATILETPDGIYITAPNGALWGSPIKNYNRTGKRRIDIVVGIDYADSIETGLNVLQSMMSEEPRLLADPAPQALVASLSDSAVNIQLRAWVATDDYWDTYYDLNRKIKDRITSAGLTIPFPQMDLHHKGKPS